MALSVTEANAVSTKYYDRTMTPTQIVYEKDPLFTKLKAKGKVIPGGTAITWPLEYRALNQAKAYGMTEQWNYTKKEVITEADLDWKVYGVTSIITLEERTENYGKQRVIDLMQTKSRSMKMDMKNKMITDLYTENTSGNGMSSLDTIVDSSSDYAGIAVSDVSDWAANEDTAQRLTLYGAGASGSRSLSYMINASSFDDMAPDFHITTRDMYSTFISRIEGKQRYVDEDMAKVGFTHCVFMGGTIVPSGRMRTDDTSSHYWFGLTLKVLYLVYHPQFNFKLEPWKELRGQGHPFALGRELIFLGNLKSERRDVHFKFTDLDPAK